MLFNDKLNLPVATDKTLQIRQVKYILQGMIVHRGMTKNSGHYLSIVTQKNNWISCDDDKVQ
jgi:ubiquitin C-terminal hydrolase